MLDLQVIIDLLACLSAFIENLFEGPLRTLAFNEIALVAGGERHDHTHVVIDPMAMVGGFAHLIQHGNPESTVRTTKVAGILTGTIAGGIAGYYALGGGWAGIGGAALGAIGGFFLGGYAGKWLGNSGVWAYQVIG